MVKQNRFKNTQLTSILTCSPVCTIFVKKPNSSNRLTHLTQHFQQQQLQI